MWYIWWPTMSLDSLNLGRCLCMCCHSLGRELGQPETVGITNNSFKLTKSCCVDYPCRNQFYNKILQDSLHVNMWLEACNLCLFQAWGYLIKFTGIPVSLAYQWCIWPISVLSIRLHWSKLHRQEPCGNGLPGERNHSLCCGYTWGEYCFLSDMLVCVLD